MCSYNFHVHLCQKIPLLQVCVFRKGGARTHNLSLLGKCFTQRQPVRMLFLKLLFLLLAASTGVEPVKYAGQSGGPYPLGYEAICWFGYSRPITPSGHASSEGLYISSIVVLLLVLWVLIGDTCYLDIRQTKLIPFNLNIFSCFKKNYIFGISWNNFKI